jgi:IS5 family transposase
VDSGLDGVTTFIVGSKDNAGSKRARRRLACYRVGAEGRISHLKREYGAGRPRLKGKQGARIWEGWAAFAYNLDTIATMKPPTPQHAAGKGPPQMN